MTTCYIAVEYGGEWEDSWEHNHLVSLDKSVIEQFIENMPNVIAAQNDLDLEHRQLYEAWMHDVPADDDDLHKYSLETCNAHEEQWQLHWRSIMLDVAKKHGVELTANGQLALQISHDSSWKIEEVEFK